MSTRGTRSGKLTWDMVGGIVDSIVAAKALAMFCISQNKRQENCIAVVMRLIWNLLQLR